MQQTPEFKEACQRLRANSDFAVFLQWVVAYGDVTMKSLVYETEKTGILQGKAQAITEILKAITRAQESK